MIVKGLLSVGALLLAAGCASRPEKLPTTYVSPMQFQNYDCDQIAMEQMRVERRTGELHTSLTKEADTDEAQAALGLILFWPALLFLEGGDGPEAAEYSRLKGEYEAIQLVALHKKCDIRFLDDLSAAAEAESAEVKNVDPERTEMYVPGTD